MTEEVENIVLIVVDALRTDRVGAYGDENLTPNIDSIAERGKTFQECYSCINTTDASISTILTGQYPTRHGVVHQGERVSDEEKRNIAGTTPLPELLPEKFSKIGVDRLGRWHQRGFDTYTNPESKQVNDIIQFGSKLLDRFPDAIEKRVREIYDSKISGKGIYLPGEIITKKSLQAIDTADSPFFLFAHYWDPHIPYPPIESHPDMIMDRSYPDGNLSLKELVEPIEGSPWADQLVNQLSRNSQTVGGMKRKYDAGVHLADQAIGNLIAGLKSRGVCQETAIIITADHGESLTEHGIFFDHHGLYDQTIHVPLIIDAPGFDGSEDSFVQHFDLVPTILDLIDVDYSERQFDGMSLCSQNGFGEDRDAIYAEEGHTTRKRTIRTQDYKYIKRMSESACRYCRISHSSGSELYDVQKDSGEFTDIITEKDGAAKSLDKQLHTWVDNLPQSHSSDVSFDENGEVLDQMEDLGYL